MSHEVDRDHLALVRIVARASLGEMLIEDTRFLAWLSARERLRAELHAPPESATERTARGAQLASRAQARRVVVQRITTLPPVVAASCIAPAGQVVQVAARERCSPLVTLGIAAGSGRELWDEAVDEWVVLPDHVSDGRHLALRIVGESMAPLMHTGDTVLVKLEQEPRVNSVIVARQEDDGYVCKRVARIEADRIELASLEAGHPAIVIPRDPARILGTVLLVWSASRP